MEFSDDLVSQGVELRELLNTKTAVESFTALVPLPGLDLTPGLTPSLVQSLGKMGRNTFARVAQTPDSWGEPGGRGLIVGVPTGVGRSRGEGGTIFLATAVL